MWFPESLKLLLTNHPPSERKILERNPINYSRGIELTSALVKNDTLNNKLSDLVSLASKKVQESKRHNLRDTYLGQFNI